MLERSGSGPVAEQECVLSTLAEGQDHLLALPAFPAPPRPLSELAPAPLPSMPQQAITPWADHNVTAKLSVYSPTAETGPVLSGQTLKRHLDTGYPMHESTSRCGRWAVEVDRGPDGSIRDSRLVAKDGSGATYRHGQLAVSLLHAELNGQSRVAVWCLLLPMDQAQRARQAGSTSPSSTSM